MLARYANELATTTTNRNIKLNEVAFHVGTMVAREWVDRVTVEATLWAACESNGLAGEEAEKSRDTMTRALDEGAQQPHEDLEESERQTQASVLADVARAADLFHAPDGTSYADVEIDGHR